MWRCRYRRLASWSVVSPLRQGIFHRSDQTQLFSVLNAFTLLLKPSVKFKKKLTRTKKKRTLEETENSTIKWNKQMRP